MVKVTNDHADKRLTIAKIFEYDDTCILEDGRIAFCSWMDANLLNELEEEDSLLCFTVNDDGETNIENIRLDTLATPCNVKITVD